MRIARYLQCIVKFRLFYKINLNKGLEVYIATNFAGLQTKETTLDPKSILSQTSFVILLFGYLLFQYSKLQTEIALSTTEAEYIVLSQALCSTILLLNLINEIFLPSSFLLFNYLFIALYLRIISRLSPSLRHHLCSHTLNILG